MLPVVDGACSEEEILSLQWIALFQSHAGKLIIFSFQYCNIILWLTTFYVSYLYVGTSHLRATIIRLDTYSIGNPYNFCNTYDT